MSFSTNSHMLNSNLIIFFDLRSHFRFSLKKSRKGDVTAYIKMTEYVRMDQGCLSVSVSVCVCVCLSVPALQQKIIRFEFSMSELVENDTSLAYIAQFWFWRQFWAKNAKNRTRGS